MFPEKKKEKEEGKSQQTKKALIRSEQANKERKLKKDTHDTTKQLIIKA